MCVREREREREVYVCSGECMCVRDGGGGGGGGGLHTWMVTMFRARARTFIPHCTNAFVTQ